MGFAKKSKQKSKPHVEERKFPFRALAILISLTVIVFSPVLIAGYIRLDDYTHILDNPNLQRPSLAGLSAIWTQHYFGLYIPVTYSIWWLYAGIVNVFSTLKQGAPLFHALNLILHVVNASLVFLLLQTLLREGRTKTAALSESQAKAISLISALFFALHPAQVEAVAWISEFKGGLATMLGLLGIWNYYRSPKKLVTALLFIAAMLSKPSAIVFPGVLLFVDRMVLGKSMKESARAPIVFWILLLPLVLITKYFQPDLNMEFIPNSSERLLVAADAFSFYFYKLLFPLHLALDYGRSAKYVLAQVPGWHVALSFLLVVAGLATVIYSFCRPSQSTWRSFVLCGWAIFCLSLAPILGLVPFEFQDLSTVADHYLYFPILGASIAVVGLLTRLRATVTVLWISAAILVGMAGLSFSQAGIWRSTETLFNHTLKINPQSYVAYYGIATELFEAGRTDEGIAQTRKCLEINPNYLNAEVALGVALIREGKFQDAIDHYLAVLAKNPSSAGKRAPLIASIHNNLGMALHQVGRKSEGTEHFGKAVEVDPKSVNGHTNLGRAALDEGRFSDAVTHYQAALDLSPGNREIRGMLEFARRRVRQP
jgi:tetratricopeptide (TPR) repeat protein